MKRLGISSLECLINSKLLRCIASVVVNVIHSCPSISHCKKVYFSNAIACDGNTDNMEPREAVWGDIKCVSAFDHLGKDEPGEKSIGDFAAHMEDTMKGLSVEAGNRRVKLLEAARTNLL